MSEVRDYARIVELDCKLTEGPPVRSFMPRDEKGWRWVQQACFWLLTKIGAYKDATVTVWEFRQIEVDHVIARVLDQFEGVVKRTNRFPTRMVVGAKTWTEIVRNSYAIGQAGPLTFDITHGYRHGRIPARIGGTPITIEIIPWIDGIVVLP